MKNSFPPGLDQSPVWHPYTANPYPGPRREWIQRASGTYVFTQSGRKLFDATSSWWCNLHGHCHPQIVKAVKEQVSKCDQILFAPHAHEVGYQLADRLLDKMGKEYSKVFFSDDGSTAVESALKMCLQLARVKGEGSKRTRFLAFDKSYHGDTLGAISVSGYSDFQAYFSEKGSQTIRAPSPECYRCPVGKVFPSCLTECADLAVKILQEHALDLAGVILEPLVLGASGMLVYPKEILEKIVGEAKKLGIPVVFDEVFTGFGRTGKMFAFDHLSVKPDIVCLSKGLTAGFLPLGATVATQEIFNFFTGGESRKFLHGHTFTANPIACAAALQSLEVFDQEQVLDRNQNLVEVFEAERSRFFDVPWVGDVRHLGMIWAIELVESRGEKKWFSPPNGPGWKIAEAAWERGIWIRPLGPTLYIVPPYSTTPDELRSVLDELHGLVTQESFYQGHSADPQSYVDFE